MGIMIVVMYGGLKFMLFYDYSPFGLHRIMCVHPGPILKETVWADSASQLFVVFVLSYVFAGVHHLHYVIFKLVVDFLAKHEIVKKSGRQILTPKRLEQILKEMRSTMDKERDQQFPLYHQENYRLYNTIYELRKDQMAAIENSYKARMNAKHDLCILTDLIKKYLQEKAPQLFCEWSDVLEAANSNINYKRD